MVILERNNNLPQKKGQFALEALILLTWERHTQPCGRGLWGQGANEAG